MCNLSDVIVESYIDKTKWSVAELYLQSAEHCSSLSYLHSDSSTSVILWF